MKFFAFLLVVTLAQNAIAGPLDFSSSKAGVPAIFHPLMDTCYSIGQMLTSILKTSITSSNFLRVPTCMSLFEPDPVSQDELDKSMQCIDNLGSIADKVLAKLPQEQLQFLKRVESINEDSTPNILEMLQLSQQARKFFRVTYEVMGKDPETQQYLSNVVKCTDPILELVKANFQKATDAVNTCITQ